MLLPMLIDREALEVNVPARPKLRFDRARNVDGRLHVQLLHAAFHDAELERNASCHFDRAAEGDFSITLGEMQVSNTELRALDVHG
jgi:hypothetical protein